MRLSIFDGQECESNDPTTSIQHPFPTRSWGPGNASSVPVKTKSSPEWNAIGDEASWLEEHEDWDWLLEEFIWAVLATDDMMNVDGASLTADVYCDSR